MSNYDDFLEDKPKSVPAKKKKKANQNLTWNLLTVVMLLMTMCACFFMVNIFQNPYSGLNLLAPNTLVPPPATATWTPIGYAPTWTPTVTVPPTETSTPRPTYTIEPTATAYVLATVAPFSTSTLTTTPPARTARPAGVPYNITVSYDDSTTRRAGSSCLSMYVAGKALDSQSKPVVGLQVKLGGSIPGKTFVPALTTLTGISPDYGQSGFEFDLKIAPVASSKGLWIQLYDQSGAPLSEQVKLTTYADCKKNLIFVNFQQR
jgi:hypothetical protein